MSSILIIDDDELLCEAISAKLKRMDHKPHCCHTLTQAKATCQDGRFDLIFLDVQMPDGNGLDLITELRQLDSSPEVIIITGQGHPDGAEIAIRSGAWCYLEKHSIIREMVLPLTRALEYRAEKLKAIPVANGLNRDQIIGSSPRLIKCIDLMGHAAGSQVNVLITGETGTGKEIFARTIHKNSSRADKNFVVVDCAALPENLVESILFGHSKGAFTGATTDRKGLIKQAHGGTLFLDEIGELPLQVQKSFLRVLQERHFRPVGTSKVEESDFRLIAATNRDLDILVNQGLFRQDLLYRLDSLKIHLPALRVREKDVIDLATFYLEQLCARYGHEKKSCAPEFLAGLQEYAWPGNVRELFHTLDRVFAVSQHSQIIYNTHLPEEIQVHLARSSVRRPPTSQKPKEVSNKLDTLPPWKEFKSVSEHSYLLKLISTTTTIKEACALSGLSRARLYQLLAKHDLSSKNRDN